MPDWRNPADYEYTAGLTLHQWAWEFLRRNPDFRARYLALEKDASDRRADASQDAFAKLGREFNLLRVFHPDRTAAEVTPSWSIGAGVRLLWNDPPVPGIGSLGPPGIPWPGFPCGLALVFDLREAPEPQLEHARRLIQYFREGVPPGYHAEPYRPKTKPQPRKYPAYIRALDGSDAGVPQREIGRVLFPEGGPRTDADAVRAAERERKKAANAIKAARELADGLYRDLLYKANL